MEERYKPLYKQAAALQHHFHDYTHHTANDPAAKMLRQQIHHLTNDLASGKNPRSIENRMKTIQTQLKRTQQQPHTYGLPGQSPILNTNQSVQMHKNFEMMRRNIRQMPHY